MADNISDSEDQVDFSSGESGASKSYPQQCSALRKNGFVLLKDRPCKIVEMSTSKTGKHGHAKVHLVGIDIFNGKKYEDICPSTHNMMVPHVTRTEYSLLNIEDGFVQLMADSGDVKEDVRLPAGDIGVEIKDKFDKEENLKLTVIKSMDEEQVVAYKIESDSKK